MPNNIYKLANLGADVNAVNSNGLSALTIVAKNRLRRGVVPNPKAAFNSLKILLDYGADPNFKSINDFTPLHVVAINGTREKCVTFYYQVPKMSTPEQNPWTRL